MYKKNILKEYISKSELRVFNDKIKVRLSKELAKKYDAGSYTNYLNNYDYNYLTEKNSPKHSRGTEKHNGIPWKR